MLRSRNRFSFTGTVGEGLMIRPRHRSADIDVNAKFPLLVLIRPILKKKAIT